MPRGDKSKYTDKQKRKAEHIEEGYEERGVPEKEAERRAWATVNKETGGGNKSGSGRGVPDTNVAAKKGGRIGGARLREPPRRGPLRFGQEGGGDPQAQRRARASLTQIAPDSRMLKLEYEMTYRFRIRGPLAATRGLTHAARGNIGR